MAVDAGFVQVITEWRAEDPTFVFDISKFKQYYKHVKSIEIVNGIFCLTVVAPAAPLHAHFTNTKKQVHIQTMTIIKKELQLGFPDHKWLNIVEEQCIYCPIYNLMTLLWNHLNCLEMMHVEMSMN